MYIHILLLYIIYIHCTLEESTLRVLGGNLNLQSRIKILNCSMSKLRFSCFSSPLCE